MNLAYIFLLSFASVSGAAAKLEPSSRRARQPSPTALPKSSTPAPAGLSSNASTSTSCATVGQQFDDVASRTVLAPLVFEGRVSRVILSSTAASGTTVDVVFTATRVLKGKIDATDGVQSDSTQYPTVVVGPFVEVAPASGRPKSNGPCATTPALVPPMTTAKQQQQLFIVFASLPVQLDRVSANSGDASSDDRNVELDGVRLYCRVEGQPVAVSKQVLKDVDSHSCATCARRPGGVQLKPDGSTMSVGAGSSWNLECKAGQGRPAPVYSWFKGDVELRSRAGLQIKNVKKRGSRVSRLMVTKATESDVGSYKCRVSNVVGYVDTKSVHVSLVSESIAQVSIPSNKSHSKPCPVQGFCLNEGTCFILDISNAKYCECPKNFIGIRCEAKLPEAKKSTDFASESRFQINDSLDYFMLIALSAVAFAVSLATAIFVCCHLRKCAISKPSVSDDTRIHLLQKSPAMRLSNSHVDVHSCRCNASISQFARDSPVSGSAVHVPDANGNGNYVPVLKQEWQKNGVVTSCAVAERDHSASIGGQNTVSGSRNSTAAPIDRRVQSGHRASSASISTTSAAAPFGDRGVELKTQTNRSSVTLSNLSDSGPETNV